MTNDEFVKANEDLIQEIIEIKSSINTLEDKYRQLREKLYNTACKNNIQFPLSVSEFGISLRRCGGIERKFNYSKLERKYPKAYRDCVSHVCKPSYLAVYKLPKKKGEDTL